MRTSASREATRRKNPEDAVDSAGHSVALGNSRESPFMVLSQNSPERVLRSLEPLEQTRDLKLPSVAATKSKQSTVFLDGLASPKSPLSRDERERTLETSPESRPKR